MDKMDKVEMISVLICIVVFILVTSVAWRWISEYRTLEGFRDDCKSTFLIPKANEVIRAIGAEKGKDFIQKTIVDCPHIYFDGADRFCNIHREFFFFIHGRDVPQCQEYSDGIGLTKLNSIQISPAYWYGPPGLRIKDVSFTQHNILVKVYGNVKIDYLKDCSREKEFTILESEPLEISIPWDPNGTKPEPGTFHESLKELLKP